MKRWAWLSSLFPSPESKLFEFLMVTFKWHKIFFGQVYVLIRIPKQHGDWLNINGQNNHNTYFVSWLTDGLHTVQAFMVHEWYFLKNKLRKRGIKYNCLKIKKKKEFTFCRNCHSLKEDENLREMFEIIYC